MLRTIHYKLLGHDPVPCGVFEWAKWFQRNDRRVALTDIMSDSGEPVKISTVFLGLDHNHGGIGEPILFETMVFGGLLNQWQWRYSTWEEAEDGHAEVVARARRVEIVGDDSSVAALAAEVIARTVIRGPG